MRIEPLNISREPSVRHVNESVRSIFPIGFTFSKRSVAFFINISIWSASEDFSDAVSASATAFRSSVVGGSMFERSNSSDAMTVCGFHFEPRPAVARPKQQVDGGAIPKEETAAPAADPQKSESFRQLEVTSATSAIPGLAVIVKPARGAPCKGYI